MSGYLIRTAPCSIDTDEERGTYELEARIHARCTEDIPIANESCGWSLVWRPNPMCRNIKTLFNFEPPATEEEINAASLQYVRKITGFNKPSRKNEAAFDGAVEDIARITQRLLASLETNAPSKDREEEAARAKARAALRFGG